MIPTLDVLEGDRGRPGLVGNHEFDKGWSDLKDRVIPQMVGWPRQRLHGGHHDSGRSAWKASTIVQKGGLDIAIVGAVTRASRRSSRPTASRPPRSATPSRP